jgi:hypothetical protein
MQELFRFYAIRAAEPLPDDEHVNLDTGSGYQGSLAAPNADATTAVTLSRSLIDQSARALLRDLDTLGNPIRAFKARLDKLDSSEDAAPVDEWVREDFQQNLETLNHNLDAGIGVLKDAIVALRVLKIVSAPRGRVAARAIRAAPGTHPISANWPNPLAQVVPQLMLDLRVRTALAAAGAGPVSVTYMKGAMSMGMTFSGIDKIQNIAGILVAPPPSAADTLARDKQRLQDLGELIRQVRLACPSFLVVTDDNGVTMTAAYASGLANAYSNLIAGLAELPGQPVPGDLIMNWVALHTLLEDKAFTLQKVIDDETPASTTPASPNASSPIVGGHMQLAGVADVHVVLNHVVKFEKAELAQIENILLGENRSRTYRTLLRNETDTESTTETTTTQEREVKTEDRSDLKSETDNSLKEVLDLKASVDVQYKQGDSLKLNLNASVAYNRTKEEATKVATDFAKDVTNRAAQKVVQTVRQSIKSKILRETEETILHGFDNAVTPGGDNVIGVYQWIEKVYENAHLTVGGPAAIFDGVVLQPAQRLLTAPPSADGALGSATPPPPLDTQPSDIHPWNYLTLASRFGATGIAPPPPFSSSTSFSSAGGDSNPEEGKPSKAAPVAHDIAIPDDTMAACAAVVFDAQDNKGDDPDHAEGQASIGVAHIDSSNLGGHARFDHTVLLQGERGLVPFAAYFYWNTGYELTVDVTCIRTVEAYQRWQLAVYAGLAAARAQAQQAYDERVARAAVQTVDMLGPSPGRIDQLIRDEIKRCAIGVLARQAAGKNIYDRIGDLYQSGQTDEIARLCLLYEHAFAWENMSYVLYPYYWADNANNGWALHTSRSESDENWAAFLRAGAARVVVPVRDGFVRLAGLGVVPNEGDVPINPLQMLQEDISAILDGTLSFDDLLSVSSGKALSAAKESALRAQVMDQWVEHEHWFLRTPTELVMLRKNGIPLPEWEWNKTADFTQGITTAWQVKQE